MNLIKPNKLSPGDKVVTISPSSGSAGEPDLIWRYYQGKKRLEEEFGLNVCEMEHTLKGRDYVYEHPEKRAEDLMNAFKDPEVKGIITCIGGCESVRMLPYIDFDVIRNNPKIVTGYSDNTILHLICLKAGISSFYGPTILCEFAENVEMIPYTKKWFEKAVFNNEVIGKVEASDTWINQYLPWDIENKDIKRTECKNRGYELLQGKGVVRGQLIGGCIEVLEMAKGTSLWPEMDKWEKSIIFFETSEETPEPSYLEYWLRNYGTQGILQVCNGMIFGKPCGEKYYDEYKEVIYKVIRNELGLKDLPILYDVNFGHASPIITIPYGAMAEIDCTKNSFYILESGVK